MVLVKFRCLVCQKGVKTFLRDGKASVFWVKLAKRERCFMGLLREYFC